MRALRLSPQIHYEPLDTATRPPSAALRRQLDRIITDGWKLGRYRLALQPPINWKHANRSFEFHAHAWDPVSLLIAGYEGLGEERYLDAALAICDDWLRVHQAPLLEGDRETALNAAEAHTDTMAWYDMGTGQRAYRLAYLADVMGRNEHTNPTRFAQLFEAVRFHCQLLSRSSFFADHTNHGLYQALGQLAAARRFRFLTEFELVYKQASGRLDLMFERSFFESGVHREHSPGYHLMILNSLLGARSAGLLSQETYERLRLAEEALGWMLGPRGTLATIGDTDYNELSTPPEQLGQFRNPHVLHAMSGGQVGEPPESGLRAYLDAGVVFVRDRRHGCYLAHAAAFHSRTHKHADHFTFVWWDRDEEVLVDPGRFGYLQKTAPGSEEHRQGFWYADPRRIYVEKTRAHNCVEIDEQDYPRRGVKPFGSALIQAEQQGDLYVTGAETRHLGHVRHRRNLVLRPGHFMLVLDWLYDRTGGVHDFKQWFQLGQQWEPDGADEVGTNYYSSLSGQRIWITTLLSPAAPVSNHGQTKPYMSGWRSDKAESLIPTTSLHFSAAGGTAAFATLLLLGSGQPAAGTRANKTLRKGRFCWTEAEQQRSVETNWLDDKLHAVFE
jgi:hypothetical protein